MFTQIRSLFSTNTFTENRMFHLVYALFRFYCGISIAIGAGLPKIFHKINPEGPTQWDNLTFGTPDWFIQQVEQVGFTVISPQFWAVLAAYGEFVGGLLIAVGLLTRISAIQMAFQFWVVSFIWFKEPMPFSMYYQQLIFWSFLLIAAGGSGRYALDAWISHRKTKLQMVKPVLTSILLAFVTISGNAQEKQDRVSYTLTNNSLRGRQLEIRGLVGSPREKIGYGCQLGALQSRSDNKPVGTRIYLKSKDQWELVYVLGIADNGKTIDITKKYEISREQWLQVANDEQTEKTLALEDVTQNPDMETVAAQLGLDMITFKIRGNSPVGKHVHVRAQLPFDQERSTNGFSRKLSMFTTVRASYPVGTKIYLCEGPYWNGPVKETLLLEVDAEKSNYLIRI